MTPTILEIVAAFEADQRQKNAAAAKEAADRKAAFNAKMQLLDDTISSIAQEFKPVLDRAYPETQAVPLGCRYYWGPSGNHLVIRCYHSINGLMFEVGSSFADPHRLYLRDRFTTPDVTEFKVIVAQRIGIRLASIKEDGA